MELLGKNRQSRGVSRVRMCRLVEPIGESSLDDIYQVELARQFLFKAQWRFKVSCT